LAPDVESLLATAGYFSPKVEAQSAPIVDGEAIVVRITVTAGSVAHVGAADNKITGTITADPAEAARISQVSRRWRLQPGTPFRQSWWDEPKELLLRGTAGAENAADIPFD